MAMIQCPECGKEISDKAKKCIHCGKILVEEPKRFCSECGKEIPLNITECPYCGCPVIVENKSNKKSTKNVKIIIILIVIIVSACGILFGVSSFVKKAPARTAMNIITDDKGEDSQFYEVYYNKDENACVVYFNNGKVNDVAVVLLDSNEVGYKNLYELSELGLMMADTEEQRQKIAEGIISDPYDPVYVNNVENGNEDWELIYQTN